MADRVDGGALFHAASNSSGGNAVLGAGQATLDEQHDVLLAAVHFPGKPDRRVRRGTSADLKQIADWVVGALSLHSSLSLAPPFTT
jgi:hypothetical protein